MDVICKRHTELPHTSKLFSDLLYNFERVSAFYAHNPLNSASYGAAAAAIDYPAERRERLIAALRAQNGDSPLLQRLAQPGTVAVLTGQQVGLFSGPSYTVYKALTAIRMAKQLSDQGIDAVPVFWLATEDHDLAEVSTVWTFDAAHQPVHLRIPAAESDRPVGGIALDHPPLAELRASLAAFPYGDEIATLVDQCYQPGRSFGESFAALVKRLLAPYGLLFFDPMSADARELAAPILRRAVEAAPGLTEDVLVRNRQLNDAGYHAQVHMERHTSLFFVLENGHRVNLRRKNGDYQSRDRKYSTAELMDRAAALSPNAILRPVVQDFMFPTVAYIGGPAELAYLAQSQVIYRQLLGRMPVAAPRTGFTLIDSRARKLMERYQLRIESFYGGLDHLQESIAARLTPPGIAANFEDLAGTTKANLRRLRGSIADFDPTLANALDRSAAKIEYQVGKMQRKVAREALRRSERAKEESTYLFGLLYPHKHLQERFYTILPFLARHGTDLIEQLYDNVHLDCADHHIVYL